MPLSSMLATSTPRPPWDRGLQSAPAPISSPLRVGFLAGGLLFCGIDIWLGRHQTSGSQLVAVVSDFIPEAIAPQAKPERAFAPPLGAILGFLPGLVCHQLVG